MAYLPAKLCGVWQSLQVATEWWLDLSQPLYWSFIMWQFAHDEGSLLRYE